MTEKPLNRAERRKQETRASLLGAAAQLLATRTYADLSVRAIADLADVGYGTFYLHFADKDEIVWEIMEMMIDQTNKAHREAVASIPPREREFAALKQFFNFVQINKDSFLSVAGRHGSPVLAARHRDKIAAINLKNIERQDVMPNNSNVPFDFAANFAAGAVLRLAVWWLENDIAYSVDEMAEMFYKVIYQMDPPSNVNNQQPD